MDRVPRDRPQAAAVTVLAPAKINLTLEILGRRPDGYHDIASVMQALDLADELAIGIGPGSGISVQVVGAELPAGPTNLAYRAAASLLAALGAGGREVNAGGDPEGARTGETPRVAVSIRLHKRIPVAAGLGGGSADAAAVLLGLNHLFGRPLGAAALQRVAAALGSDVPFFLTGGTCLATGRGERLRRLPPLPDLQVVVVAPCIPVETQWAYAARSAGELTASGGSSSMLESAIRERSISRIARALVNDLEEVVARRYGVVAGVLEELRRGEIVGARMSGSGSAAYALVAEEAEALALAGALRRRNHPVHVCRPCRSGSRILP